ncbi:3-hydroxyisobutyryl-CoA hydrolase-like protein 1, mitochondrial [Rutidosis leptorrhynchoides]|uniref:3-hydroxyisobutyryl-CoA hydrolase-like protein 1, mitochondrial n=1 Tax=Rutidosis leptorrhynchoides TaxID=125765 RepID=UPI003A9947C0
MQILTRRRAIHQFSRIFLDQFKRTATSVSSISNINTSPSNQSRIGDSESSVLVEGHAYSRTVVFNRPSSLNALNTDMGNRLQKLYRSWEDTPNIGFVVMKGSGRAFSAGGDIVFLYDKMKKGNIEECKEFFWALYNFMYLVGTYLKPHVAILDGITMGGGAGVSIPGTFRVATDKTVFSTPETLIGFHPDAGASFHLSHLPGYLGEYMALTGDRLNGVEMIACGLATHYSPSANVPAIEECLNNLITDDPSVVETAIQKYSDLDYPSNASVIRRIETLDKCFSCDTVEEIIDALESEAAKTNDGWCSYTLKKLKCASPLSLKVALRSIREGRIQTFDQCLVREYRMSLQAISRQISNDFYEGVRARVVDKDFAPKWDPPSLEQVSQDMVDQYFSPLSALEPELNLPTKQREAFM